MMNLSLPSVFESRPELYDALVDWSKRLGNEGPFYRTLFEEVSARRVLDAACGTGHHAELFHSWGLEVEGADLSAGMVDYCRKTIGEPAGLHWVRRSFEQPPELPGQFDAVVCVGNSLALAADLPAVRRAIAAMHAALRQGGVCIVQVVNLWRVPEGPTQWQQCRRVRLAGEDHLLMKGLHRAGNFGHIDLVDVRLTADAAEPRYDAARFIGIEPDDLLGAARDAGGAAIRLLGSIQASPYVRDSSPDLILVSKRT
jgi:SAM-dependent methyltransferase